MNQRTKKILKWTGIALLSPVVLFVLLVVLLYIPPIQNWAVKKVAEYASEKTGMQITIQHVDIGFPLDIGADGVLIIQEGDTVADIRRLVADVKFWPLLGSRIELEQLELNKAKINTREFIEDMGIKGRFDQLAFHTTPEGIDLKTEILQMHNARLKNADLTIMLSDTAVIDTTDIIQWKIKFDQLAVENSRFKILLDSAAHFDEPTTTIEAYMGQAVAKDGLIDLAISSYDIGHLDWKEGHLSYDSLFAFNDLHLVFDDLHSQSPDARLNIKEAQFVEPNLGLQVTQASGPIAIDSLGIRLPDFRLATPYSTIQAKADIDYDALNDSIDTGSQMNIEMDAAIGKSDLMLFLGDTPEMFQKLWPDQRLTIKGSLSGNVHHATISQLIVELPLALRAEASGTISNLLDTDHLLGQLNWKVKLLVLKFLQPFLPGLGRDFNIPHGLNIEGRVEMDGPTYKADVALQDGNGWATLKGTFNTQAMAYDAKVNIRNLNIHHFLPRDSLFTLTANATISGQGTDFMKRSSWLKADATVSKLRYGHTDIENISATARLNDGHAIATINSDNKMAKGSVSVDALLGTNDLRGTVETNFARLNLYDLGLSDEPLHMGLCGDFEVESDMNVSHKLSGLIEDIYISDSVKTFHPEKVGLLLNTNPDTTYVRMQSGNFIVKFDANEGYEPLADRLSLIADSLGAQFTRHVIDQTMLKQMLPHMRLYISSGRNNPFADILRTSSNIQFNEMLVDLNTSPQKGLNGGAYIYGLNADSTRIDTIRLTLSDRAEGLSYQLLVRNNKRNPQMVFKALLDGRIYDSGAVAGLRFYDSEGKMGLRLGAYVAIEDEGVRFRLMPERPTLGYKEFALNKDNYIFLRNDSKLQAKIDLIADDGTGIKVYSEEQDTDLLQDLTISLNRFDLNDLTAVIPYFPHITGILDGDYHLMMNTDHQISVASDMEVRQMVYEDSPMGDIAVQFVYMQREDETHAVDATLTRNGMEIGTLQGEYRTGVKAIDADLQLTRLPLLMANGFIPDHLIGFNGYADGTLSIKGTLSRPNVNGQILLDSAGMVSEPYGIRLRFNDAPVSIEGSKLLFNNFAMYAVRSGDDRSTDDNPLKIQGSVDFSNLDRMRMDMQIQAKNFLLINSKQNAKSVAFGKMFVNFFARLNGPMEMLRVRGQLDVLGTTDLRYILLDSPLSTDNSLDELVRFTDFTDTTQTVVQRPVPNGLDMDLGISIDQGAHARCDLNAAQTNYVDLYGGGNLRLRYNSDGLSLTGRYTVESGSMKYSLPIIPLKTFTIQNGSYVEFTGDPTNPTLNLTATEHTRATVGQEGEATRSVAFDCGVVVTKTLSDMGLQFIISAPEDLSVENELQAMGAEQRGKLAVTMLTTGMYLADGNTGGFSMNSALSSFLQSEINNITGNALKTLDLSVGLDNTTDASGQMHTDYSFRFAKRFWNNRLKVQIGGKVSTGAEVQGQNQSFFDNVSMEYRLSPTANQYVKLFYNQNVYDWLEGYTGEYGAGFIWKRKLDTFGDIFKFSHEKK